METSFFCGDEHKELIGILMVFSKKAIIADHLKMLVRDMDDQAFDKIGGGYGFGDESVVFVLVVVKRDGIAVIMVDAGGGDDGPAQIPGDVFDHIFVVGKGRLGVNIEAVRAIFVNVSFGFFEGFADAHFHMVEEGGAERTAEQGIIEVLDRSPYGFIACAAFGKKDVDMGVPFEIATERVEDTNKAWRKTLGLVHLEEHARDHVADSVEEAIEKLPVFAEIGAEFFRDGKNAVSVFAVDQLERHSG